MLCGSTCRDSALVRSMFRYTWGLRMLKVAARPRRPGLAFPFWTSSAVLRESSLRPRLRRSSTIIWKPPVWPRPRMGGGITTKASASWIPERSRLRPETIRSWVSPLLRSLQFLYTMNVVVTFGTLAKSRTENPPMVTHPASPSVLSRRGGVLYATARDRGRAAPWGRMDTMTAYPLYSVGG